MARIIKKAITPMLLAYSRRTALRNYSTSSSIFINPQLKKNSSTSISLSSSSLIYEIRTPTRDFSSSSIDKKGPSGSGKIIGTGEEAEDFLKKVVETPSGFPFKIEDKPGEQTITLTRKYMGDYINVIVHMPGFSTDVNKEENGDDSDDQNNQEKDSVNGPQSSIRLIVTDTNFRGTTLEYGVIAYPDEFSIDSFCIKYAYAPDEENIYYKGLDYAKLDKNLQKEFQRRLKLFGIIPSTTNFLHEYMANRDMYSSHSSNSPTLTDQITPESLLTTFLNDEGIPADPAVGNIV
ncbi:hypothetical protein C5167_003865 [Papaver somniferum]|uniref:Uncharacterized protein n=1 Tax=Papaver somniferum TaxID=3469 RepID=A0A4Y7L1W2_PAPSO|nr:hypothetical protein C5167_003865 [Papaver somniferum]